MKETKRKWTQLNVNDVVRSVDLLEDAHRVAPSLGLPWPPPEDISVCRAVVRAGDAPDVLARAVALRCPLQTAKDTDFFDDCDYIEKGIEGGCWHAAIARGRVGVMAWLRHRERLLGEMFLTEADRECLCKKLHWTWRTCAVAIIYGQLAALQWLRAPERRDGPCPRESAHSCWRRAVEHKRVPVMAWLFEHHANECTLDEDTCMYAAETMRLSKDDALMRADDLLALETLQWLRDKGATWNGRTCSAAQMANFCLFLYISNI